MPRDVVPRDEVIERAQSFLPLPRRVNGCHYALTSEDWLRNLDKNKSAAIELLGATYGRGSATMWFCRWRVFFLSCAELFAYNNGEEWFVAHYLFRKKE